MQDDQLFAGSIAENICFFDAQPDHDRIAQCARLAAVHDDIAGMAMQYNTLVGDMGTVLSDGQKQRILLARALYREPTILFLDEATSHLDIARERSVNDAIRGAPPDPHHRRPPPRNHRQRRPRDRAWRRASGERDARGRRRVATWARPKRHARGVATGVRLNDYCPANRRCTEIGTGRGGEVATIVRGATSPGDMQRAPPRDVWVDLISPVLGACSFDWVDDRLTTGGGNQRVAGT